MNPLVSDMMGINFTKRAHTFSEFSVIVYRTLPFAIF